ncbi:MAG: hypothetical protein GSR77_02035 [Desulfurococcales archaeon]|nr:hypothetical protein [Desulfurococcales archaeon]
MESIARSLKNKGYKIYLKEIKYSNLTGSLVTEKKLVAYNFLEGVKISLKEDKATNTYSLYVLIRGKKATSSIASRLESIGGSVDLEEGERLFGVVRQIPENIISRLIESL